MTYIAKVSNQQYRVDTGENGQQRSVMLEGVEHTIDWRAIAPLAADSKGNVSAGGRYSLIIGGISYEIFARNITKPGEKEQQTYEIYLGGQRFEVSVEDERTMLLAGLTKTGAGSSASSVQAPMPGLVIGVPVEQGAEVSQGQTVIVLEAMKMENDLAAPISGIVKEVRVSQGQTVDQGEVLVVIEKE